MGWLDKNDRLGRTVWHSLPEENVRPRLCRRKRSSGGCKRSNAGLAQPTSAQCWPSPIVDVRYFTDFRPSDGVLDIALALLLLPNTGAPALLVGDGCLVPMS
jgi:hypothetical protein